jgi:putative SOS response-associated peptidase YedK
MHNRQLVVLQPESWSAWLRLSQPERELLRCSRLVRISSVPTAAILLIASVLAAGHR